MGFDPASLLAEATATFSAGSAATGATAATAATAAASTAATGAGLASAGSALAGTAAAGTAATGAAAGLSSSVLASLGASAIATGAAAALAPKPPKPGGAPQAPNLFGANKGATALLSDSVGNAGGTFLSGSNNSAQIDGGKKTLLGQ